MLLFHLGQSQYAIPAQEVVEVTPQVELEPIAKAPGYIRGLFDYRGQNVPVVDLRQVIHNRHCNDSLTTRVILVRFPLSCGETRTLGLLAERVTETVRIKADSFSDTGVRIPDTPYLGQATRHDTGLIQKVNVKDLLPEAVQLLLFPARAG
jgi:chemotaxis-related protein WspB